MYWLIALVVIVLAPSVGIYSPVIITADLRNILEYSCHNRQSRGRHDFLYEVQGFYLQRLIFHFCVGSYQAFYFCFWRLIICYAIEILEEVEHLTWEVISKQECGPSTVCMNVTFRINSFKKWIFCQWSCTPDVSRHAQKRSFLDPALLFGNFENNSEIK